MPEDSNAVTNARDNVIGNVERVQITLNIFVYNIAFSKYNIILINKKIHELCISVTKNFSEMKNTRQDIH